MVNWWPTEKIIKLTTAKNGRNQGAGTKVSDFSLLQISVYNLSAYHYLTLFADSSIIGAQIGNQFWSQNWGV